MPQMGFKVKKRRYIDQDILEERKEFKKKMSQYRKWHEEEYAKIQARVDNIDFAGHHTEIRRRDLARERKSIIRVAMSTKYQITHLKKREIEREVIGDWQNVNVSSLWMI